MKRNSLVGPLLIILIGMWFLMSSLRPDWPLLDMAAKFWPFVLIGWGFLRLMEIFFWAMQGRPLPVAGVSGGEWTAVVFLCLFGSGLYAINRHTPDFTVFRGEIFGHHYDFTVPEQTAAAPKASRVVVENLRGAIRVTGAEVQEVKVSGRKSINAFKDEEANAADRQSPVEISTQDAHVVVRTNQERVSGSQRIATDLEVTVPKGVNVEIRGRDGDVEVTDVEGGVQITTDKTTVRLHNIGGEVRLDLQRADLVRASNVKGNTEIHASRGGDVEMDGMGGEISIDGSFSGDLELRECAKMVKFQSPHTDLRVEKVPGQIHLDLGTFTATNVVGPVRLNSNRSRDVHMEQFTEAAELTLDKGDITLRPMTSPAPRIDARTRNGEIDLALPEGAKFDLKATTNRGELNNDYGAPIRAEYNNERRREGGGVLVGGAGHGAPMVLTTERGGITIRKDPGGPVAVAPARPSEPSRPKEIQIEIQAH